jgi:hypothetical protein
MGRRRSSCSYLLVYLNLSLTIDLSHYEPYIVLGRWGRWGIKLQLKGTKQHLIWGRSVPGPVGPKSEPETSVEARISTGLKPRSRPGSNRDPDWSQTELSQFCLWLVLEGSQFGARLDLDLDRSPCLLRSLALLFHTWFPMLDSWTLFPWACTQ